jgi:exopolyphosphatase
MNAGEVPPDLATLLLAAIVIDTNGLKMGGTATKVDRDAASFLLPQTMRSIPTLLSQDHTVEADKIHESAIIQDLAADLKTKKESVDGLSTLDLLRRDYKEETIGSTTIKLGISSVPRRLESCDDLWTWSKRWMAHRGLAVFGVLTSFRDEGKVNKSGKPKHKREQAWLVFDKSEMSDEREEGEVDWDDIASRLWKGLEGSKELELKKHGMRIADEGKRVKVYQQGNVDATRKVTAPLVKSILGECWSDDGPLTGRV